MDLSLVLACYNEEPWLADSVGEIVKILDAMNLGYEIILVDDASRDGTRQAIGGIMKANPETAIRAIFHDVNTGWGGAVADGFRSASGDIVGFIDVDLEIHPRFIPACVAAIRAGAQVAVCHRSYKFVVRGLWRRCLSACYAVLVRLFLPVMGPENTAAGMKFYRRTDLLPVMEAVHDPGWFWDLELLVRCRLAGMSMAMVPCVYIRNPAKPSSVRVFRYGIECLSRLAKLRGELRRSGRLTGRGAALHP